jgi:hypothetical protein
MWKMLEQEPMRMARRPWRRPIRHIQLGRRRSVANLKLIDDLNLIENAGTVGAFALVIAAGCH